MPCSQRIAAAGTAPENAPTRTRPARTGSRPNSVAQQARAPGAHQPRDAQAPRRAAARSSQPPGSEARHLQHRLARLARPPREDLSTRAARPSGRRSPRGWRRRSRPPPRSGRRAARRSGRRPPSPPRGSARCRRPRGRRAAAGATSSNSRRTSSRPRLLVGSSRTRTRQPTANARAISTSCCARRREVADHGLAVGCRGARAAPGRPARGPAPRACRTRPSARRLQAEHDVLHDREVRRQRQLLVDHGHAGPPRLQRTRRRGRARRPEPSCPRPRPSAPERTPMSVLLPAPFCPTSAHTSPRAHRERRRRRAPPSPPKALRMPRISKRGAQGRHCFSHCDRSGCSSSFIVGLVHVLRAWRRGRPCRCASRPAGP